MPTVFDFYRQIDVKAPFSTALDFDNSGLLVGSHKNEVKACLLALDITNDVIDKAVSLGANLIITHHPVIFNPIKSINFDGVLYRLTKNDINVISAHTNLDLCDYGVNGMLAQSLMLSNVTTFHNGDELGRVGSLPHKMTAEELACYVKEKLGAPNVSYTKGKEPISTVAVVGGSGKSYLKEAVSFADAYITGEVSHDTYIEAQNRNYTLVTAGHFNTEAVVLPILRDYLKEQFPNTDIYLDDEFKLYNTL